MSANHLLLLGTAMRFAGGKIAHTHTHTQTRGESRFQGGSARRPIEASKGTGGFWRSAFCQSFGSNRLHRLRTGTAVVCRGLFLYILASVKKGGFLELACIIVTVCVCWTIFIWQGSSIRFFGALIFSSISRPEGVKFDASQLSLVVWSRSAVSMFGRSHCGSFQEKKVFFYPAGVRSLRRQ